MTQYTSDKIITLSSPARTPIRVTRGINGGYHIQQGTSYLNLSPTDLDGIVAAADELDAADRPPVVSPAKWRPGTIASSEATR